MKICLCQRLTLLFNRAYMIYPPIRAISRLNSTLPRCTQPIEDKFPSKPRYIHYYLTPSSSSRFSLYNISYSACLCSLLTAVIQLALCSQLLKAAQISPPFEVMGKKKKNKNTKPEPINQTKKSSKPSTSSGAISKIKIKDANHIDGVTFRVPIKLRAPKNTSILAELNLLPAHTAKEIREMLLHVKSGRSFIGNPLNLALDGGATHFMEDENKLSDFVNMEEAYGYFLQIDEREAYYDRRSIEAHIVHTMDSIVHRTLSIKQFAEPLQSVKMDEVASFEETKCLKSIKFSQSSPSSIRKISGDLIYLDVVTLEGKEFRVSGTTASFYRTSGENDHQPIDEATTLIGLLKKSSPMFGKAFLDIQKKKAEEHPFDKLQSLMPHYSWLGPYPIQDAPTLLYGSDQIGMQRNWNEELQSAKALPRKNFYDRVVRDRALYKVSSNFVDAATRGAIEAITTRKLPVDPNKGCPIYVQNGIAFSVAEDADIKGLHKRGVNSSEVLFTYSSSNNELMATKAYLTVETPELHYLAMAIIDYMGHRVVAQSVMPGFPDLIDVNSHLYGSSAPATLTRQKDEFQKLVKEAAENLHLKEHLVLDGSTKFKLATPMECQGFRGVDRRMYLLDLTRATPRDANYLTPESCFCILRPELIKSFQSQTTEGESKQKISFNPNVFTKFQLGGRDKENKEDEENVRKVSTYLKEEVIEKFVKNLDALKVIPLPADGQTLTHEFHSRGINLRYLGEVAKRIENVEYFRDLCFNEIVVRCAKHCIKDTLRQTKDRDVCAAITRCLNCFFGTCEKNTNGNQLPTYMDMKATLWSDIEKLAVLKYQFPVADGQKKVKSIPVLRNLCQKIGITVASRKYDFTATLPFQSSDILDVQPVVKGWTHESYVASDIIAQARIEEQHIIRLSEQEAPPMTEVAECCKKYSTLVLEASKVLQMETGPLLDVAECISTLSSLKNTRSAEEFMREEIALTQCCFGLDHPRIADCYAKIAKLCSDGDENELAMKYMSRAINLSSICSGPNPRLARILYVAEIVYKKAQKIGLSEECRKEAEKIMKKNASGVPAVDTDRYVKNIN